MRKTVSGVLIFSILLFLFMPFPMALALGETDSRVIDVIPDRRGKTNTTDSSGENIEAAGKPAVETDSIGNASPVLASSAGVYADASLSGEPLRVLQKNEEVEIIGDAGKTVVKVRFTLDNGKQHVGYMSRSAFEAIEAWPGKAVRQYVAEACVRVGLMSAQLQYEEDDFSLARYRAEIKKIYRQWSRQTENTAPFDDFLLQSMREVWLVSESSFAST